MCDGDLVDGCVVFSCGHLWFDDVQDFLEHGNVQHAVSGAAGGQSTPLKENSSLRGRGGGHDHSSRGCAAAGAVAAAAARAPLLLVLLVLGVLLLVLAHRAKSRKYAFVSLICRKGCGDLRSLKKHLSGFEKSIDFSAMGIFLQKY
jgi:hypothetical protein